MTLVIVFIGAICDYYFGAVGAVLGALVVMASLSKSKANVLFPWVLLIGLCWVAGALVAGDEGAVFAIALATGLAFWFETGSKVFKSAFRRRQMSVPDNGGPFRVSLPAADES